MNIPQANILGLVTFQIFALLKELLFTQALLLQALRH